MSLKRKKNYQESHQNHNQKGFTLIELLVGLIVITVISVVAIKVGSAFYDIISRQRDIAKGERIRDGIERYYLQYYQYINSQQTGQDLILPNGCRLRTETGFVPKHRQDRNCGVAGLFFFDNEPYDNKMSNYRIVITNLLDNGRFHYRKIYVIYTKGRRGNMLSSVDANGNIRCSPDEVCWTVDGEKITLTKYEEMVKKVSDTVSKMQAYATAKYSADATKNLLMYYFANTASDGSTNSSNCAVGNKLCYFSANSVIKNSCSVGQAVPQIRLPNGGVYFSSAVNLNCLARASDLSPTIFSGLTDIYIDNGSSLIRNPERVAETDLGGYTARVVGCISDVDCIVQIAYQ